MLLILIVFSKLRSDISYDINFVKSYLQSPYLIQILVSYLLMQIIALYQSININYPLYLSIYMTHIYSIIYSYL